MAAGVAVVLALGACASDSAPPGASYGRAGRPEIVRIPGYKVGEPYQINGAWYYPAEDWNYHETGIASFYGGETQGVNFHGRYTANGEIYDMNALTAAHQTLPLPSLVRVTNLDNGRQMVLRVNDRGPFIRGRIIDVSRRGAQLLGFEGQGTARVLVENMGEESYALKLALLNRNPTGANAIALAAVQRPGIATDVAVGPRANGSRVAALAASPAPAPPAPAPIVLIPPPATLPPAAGARATSGTREVASLPVEQQARLTPVVRQIAVKPTAIWILVGVFNGQEKTHRINTQVSRFGGTEVRPLRFGQQLLYRVRMGPLNSVEEADRLLERVALFVPEAKLVVD